MDKLPPAPLKLNRYEQIRDDDHFSVTTVASMCHVDRSTVNRWINSGQMKAYMVGGGWKIPGIELKKQIRGSINIQPYLNYPQENGKYTHFGYLMYLLIITKNNKADVVEECKKYGLIGPDAGDLAVLWDRMLLLASKRIRKQLDNPLATILTVQSEDFQRWIDKLGILELFNVNPWPCLNILQDHSDKRDYIELLLWGQVSNQEIVDFLQKRWSFSLTDEQLNFYGRHFYNVYNFSDEDAERYVRKIRGTKDKIMNFRLAWRNPSAAKALLKVPHRVNFEELLHSMAALAAMNYTEYAVGGELKVPLAQAQAQVIFHAHKQLLALEKAKGEKTQVAEQVAKAADPNASLITQPIVEPATLDELDHAGAEPAAESKAG